MLVPQRGSAAKRDFRRARGGIPIFWSVRSPVLQRIPAPEFDLALTLDSGQVFYWEPESVGYVGVIGDRAAYAEQQGEQLLVAGVAASDAARYFALDHPLAEICTAFPKDAAMIAARDYCRGLRIIRQPIWECLASFITSSMKQVAHIRQMSRALRERFGDERSVRGRTLHSFPSAERLAHAAESELRACALGYRAKNLLGTAQAVASGDAALESWRELEDEELRARLVYRARLAFFISPTPIGRDIIQFMFAKQDATTLYLFFRPRWSHSAVVYAYDSVTRKQRWKTEVDTDPDR